MHIKDTHDLFRAVRLKKEKKEEKKKQRVWDFLKISHFKANNEIKQHAEAKLHCLVQKNVKDGVGKGEAAQNVYVTHQRIVICCPVFMEIIVPPTAMQNEKSSERAQPVFSVLSRTL